MAEFTIPVKQRPPVQHTVSGLNATDQSLIKDVPELLQTQVNKYIDDCNHKLSLDIENLISKATALKMVYVTDLNKTYQDMMDCIAATCESASKKMTCKIRGTYSSCYSQPSVEYWKTCNPGKLVAIECIMNELKRAGWDPTITGISRYDVDHDDGMYYRGDELIVTCDFN